MLVTPRPGVAAEALLAALRSAAMEAENTRRAPATAVDEFNAYQRWSNSEVRRLGNLVHAGDLDLLVTTPRYWILQALDPMSHGNLSGFVELELDERIRDLAAARDELAFSIDYWTNRPGVLAFVDTNVYLHHDVYFDEIDWRSALHVAQSEPVRLLVPLVVVDELDRSKRSPSSKKVSRTNNEEVRTRARITLRRLDALFSNGSQTRAVVSLEPHEVTLELLLDDPRHVRLSDADAELIDRAQALRTLVGRDVHVVTNDTGMALRTGPAGLRAQRLPD